MSTSILTKIKRAPDKVKREFLRIPILQNKVKQIYKQNLEKYKSAIAKVDGEDAFMLDSIQERGSLVTSLQKLAFPSTNLMLNSAAELVGYLRKCSPENKSIVGVAQSKLVNYPEIFLWGLEERLLNLIENYIGMPIIYHGVAVCKNLANGKLEGVRQWHIDPEDYRMIKIIIYLNDVTIDGGPYEYIDLNLTPKILRETQYSSGFIADQEIAEIIPQSDWRTCIGKYGTIIITDTCNVFHRAKPAVKTERFSLTFCYTSIKPKTIRKTWKFPPDHWHLINSQITDRQRSCLSRR